MKANNRNFLSSHLISSDHIMAAAWRTCTEFLMLVAVLLVPIDWVYLRCMQLSEATSVWIWSYEWINFIIFFDFAHQSMKNLKYVQLIKHRAYMRFGSHVLLPEQQQFRDFLLGLLNLFKVMIISFVLSGINWFSIINSCRHPGGPGAKFSRLVQEAWRNEHWGPWISDGRGRCD